MFKSKIRDVFKYLAYYHRLDTQTGQLYTKGRISAGTYDFSVKVYDRVHDKVVVSSVTVQVQEIGDDAVYNSGSLRLTGTQVFSFCSITSQLHRSDKVKAKKVAQKCEIYCAYKMIPLIV